MKSAKSAAKKGAKATPKPGAPNQNAVPPVPEMPAPPEPAALAQSAKSSPARKAVVKPRSAPAKKASKAPSKLAKQAPKPAKSAPAAGPVEETAQLFDSQVAFEGPLFRVVRDHILEPGGTAKSYRDVIRHNGSVVILAVDPGKKKKDPWIVLERQYRHAAGQYLWELPAGKLDAGETPLEGAKRELAEETGYSARRWSPLVRYYASPGFLGEAMNVFLAEGLVAGDAHPEEDENIDFRLVKLSELLEMVDKGKIIDGKTLTSILLYARQLGLKRK